MLNFFEIERPEIIQMSKWFVNMKQGKRTQMRINNHEGFLGFSLVDDL